MTMIAFRVHEDHAELMTDTLSYTPNGRHLGRTSKVTLLPHLDAAMLAQGAGGLAAMWAYELDHWGQDAEDFDALDAIAQERLPDLWDRLNERHPGSTDSIVFHVGWSPSGQRFVAYAYPSIDGFRSMPIDDFYAMPMPLSDIPAPETVDEWRALAIAMRTERGHAPIVPDVPVIEQLKVFVGGDVFHTRLERGAVGHQRIHAFPTSGPDFERMMAGTLHPTAQRGPCLCGSGRPMVGCHGWGPDTPCNCGSGSTFGDCCRVESPAHIPTEKVGRNDPCPCGSGSKHKRCCALANSH